MLERVWRKRNPSTHWWECKLVQPLWKTTRKFLRKRKIESPFVGVQSLSRLWLFATPWTVARQVSLSLTISWSLLRLMSIEVVMPSNHLILCPPLLLPPSIFPSIRVFSNESVLPMNIQDWFPLGWTGWISLHPRDAQESFPTPQFKSINSLALSFLYSPTLTSIHDYWKNHSFD